MKKAISVLGFLVLLGCTVVAQDTLSIFEVADTSLAVLEDIVVSVPQAGSVWKEFVLWGLSVLALVLGLVNYFRGKKVVVK